MDHERQADAAPAETPSDPRRRTQAGTETAASTHADQAVTPEQTTDSAASATPATSEGSMPDLGTDADVMDDSFAAGSTAA